MTRVLTVIVIFTITVVVLAKFGQRTIQNYVSGSQSIDERTFRIERYKFYFPEGVNRKNINLNMQASPNVEPSEKLRSIFFSIAITAHDESGNKVDYLDGLFKIEVDFSKHDISPYIIESIAIYSSKDGINWIKEDTKNDLKKRIAEAQSNQLGHFALMAERLDTVAPTTTPHFNGMVIKEEIFRPQVYITLDSLDNPDGLGVDYTLYKLDKEDWKQYKAPIIVTSSGTHKMEFYSVDKDENVEEIKSITFVVN